MFDVEKAVIDTLGQYYKTYSDVPADVTPTDTFITVERTNGGSENGIGSPQIAIQCWSSSRANASTLSLKVQEKLIELYEINEICKVTIENVYNFPDLVGKHPRYQIVLTIKTTEGVVI